MYDSCSRYKDLKHNVEVHHYDDSTRALITDIITDCIRQPFQLSMHLTMLRGSAGYARHLCRHRCQSVDGRMRCRACRVWCISPLRD